MSVTIKAFLYEKKWHGDPLEIRRFNLDGATASYESLLGKITEVFPSLASIRPILAWIDADGDTITISSDEELVQALDNLKGELFRLYIKKGADISGSATREDQNGAPQHEAETDSAHSGTVHPGVVCDGCNGAIHGTRFKCLMCHDYDLCSICEGKGIHVNHNMIGINRPASWNPWVQPFSGWPSGFGVGGHCGRGGWGHGRCGGRRMWHGGNQGCAGARGCHFPGQGRQCRPGTRPEENHATGDGAASEPMDTEQKGGSSEEDHRGFLRGVGEAVSSFLEPFGVKVDVLDVVGDGQSGASVPKTQSGASVPKTDTTSAPASTTSEDVIEKAVAQLRSMGYDDEGGWLTELVKAKEGDVTKVLDALHPGTD